MDVKLPTDRQTWEGEIAQYWFDDGILVSLSKSPRRTVENIKGNVALVKSITGNKPVPLLIYLSKSPIPDKATREYVNKALPEIYTAMAMISDSALAKFIMNFLFKLKPAPIPMKNFTNYDEAKEWLKQYL
jgi:hypothetical protein